MNTNTSFNPDGNRRSKAILNGIYNAYTVEEFGPRSGCFSSGEALVRSLHSNLLQALNLTRDVFLSSWDLLLLDHSHGVLGGGSKKLGYNAICKPGSPAQEDIEFILGPALTPSLPIASTYDWCGFFIPSLTMPFSARMKFSKMSALKRLNAVLMTKRVFINGETFGEYGGNGLRTPDAGFWRALFDFSESCAYSEDEVVHRSAVAFSTATSLAFWLERCIERDGGDPRFVELINRDTLLDDDDEFDGKHLHAFALEMGMDRKSSAYGLNRHGAVDRKVAGRIGLHLPAAGAEPWNGKKANSSPSGTVGAPFPEEAEKSTDDVETLGGNPHIYSRPVMLWARDMSRILLPNLGKMLSLTRNVFLSDYDLLQLDDSHGVLGGVYRDASKARREEAMDEVLESSSLERMCSLYIHPEICVDYFYPALTMSREARVKFERLSLGQQFQIALKTKRIFVNGDEFHGYGGRGLSAPNEHFWALLLSEPFEGPFMRPIPALRMMAGDLFSLEWRSDRQGGDNRFIDNLAPEYFELPADTPEEQTQRYLTLLARLKDEPEKPI